MPISVDRDELRRLVSHGAAVVDVMPTPEYVAAHLPGAIHLSLKEMTPQTVAQRLNPDRPVIVYCYDSR